MSFTGEQKNKAASHAVPQPSSSGKAASSGHKKSKDPAASAADALSALEPSFPTKGKKHKSSNKGKMVVLISISNFTVFTDSIFIFGVACNLQRKMKNLNNYFRQ